MTIRILIDMNLSPEWEGYLSEHGWPARHWSGVGDPRAKDAEIMTWATKNQHVVFTHDLDFGTLLALTHAIAPSVIQVKAQNLLPIHLGPLVIVALQKHQVDLERGALIVIDEMTTRARILPF